MAQSVIRASLVVFGLTAAVMLVVMAIKGYWGVFVPFLIVVGVWLWWVRTHPVGERD